MSIFSFLRKHTKTTDNRPELDGTGTNLPFSDHFSIFNSDPHAGDNYLYNAWVHIAVNVLIRNIARADFSIKREGNDVTSGPLYNLFRRPNTALSRFDLWKETAAWRHIEGEACGQRPLGWSGPEYAGGRRQNCTFLIPGNYNMRESFLGD
ncbi:MAG: phage portal protein [Treponema sp.]|jgi:hypothetical protein|nr:phage portal protein [Treponema sp.]